MSAYFTAEQSRKTFEMSEFGVGRWMVVKEIISWKSVWYFWNLERRVYSQCTSQIAEYLKGLFHTVQYK